MLLEEEIRQYQGDEGWNGLQRTSTTHTGAHGFYTLTEDTDSEDELRGFGGNHAPTTGVKSPFLWPQIFPMWEHPRSREVRVTLVELPPSAQKNRTIKVLDRVNL